MTPIALKLNRKDDRLGLRDFRALARMIGLPSGEAAAVAELGFRLEDGAASLRQPDLAGQSGAATAAQDTVIAIMTERSNTGGR